MEPFSFRVQRDLVSVLHGKYLLTNTEEVFTNSVENISREMVRPKIPGRILTEGSGKPSSYPAIKDRDHHENTSLLRLVFLLRSLQGH